MRRNTTREWKNVPGSLSLESEVEIRFLSSGHYCEQTWESPAEGDDCRELDKVVLTIGKYKVTLPKEVAQELFDEYQELVDAAEVEHEEPCPD